MTFQVPVVTVDSIETHPTQDHNSVVKAGGFSIVTMKNEDGSFRFAEGQAVIVVPENAVVPDYLLKATGFWNEEKNKGGLAGSKGNRVKGRTVDGVLSEALIWSVQNLALYSSKESSLQNETFTKDTVLIRNAVDTPRLFDVGDDVSEFLGITEYIPQ